MLEKFYTCLRLPAGRQGGYLFEEMTTTIALIIPMMSVYTITIIKNIIATRTPKKMKSKTVIKEYTFLTYFIPCLFIFFLTAMILLKAFNVGFASFEQFKLMLAISETAFGAYVRSYTWVVV